MLRHIPNFLTCCNLLCGCFGVVQVFNDQLIWASYFIWLGGVFDFFDGFAARAFKGNSEFGKQLDSLADVITFGVLPGMILFMLLKNSVETAEFSDQVKALLPYFAFTITAFSALRLAKFNIDTRQTTDFIGLNTPANSIFFSSFPLILAHDNLGLGSLISDYRVLITLIVIFSALLVSEIRIFGFKFKDFSFANNKIRYVFLLSAIILIVIFKYTAIPLIIILYITLSLVQQYLLKKS